MLDPLQPGVFQAVFGEVLTLLIALLATARKFIIADLRETSADHVFRLAAAVIRVVYGLMRERDDRRRDRGARS